jgi:hypothetical protein
LTAQQIDATEAAQRNRMLISIRMADRSFLSRFAAGRRYRAHHAARRDCGAGAPHAKPIGAALPRPAPAA